MRARVGFAGVMCLLAAMPVAAQPEPAPPFPVVADLPEDWDMGGAPVPLDVLGVRIGMKREDAVKALGASVTFDPNTIVESANETGIGDEYGTQVFFKYIYWWNASTGTGAVPREAALLSFSTGISGERVTGLTRNTSWETDRPRMPDLEQALVGKYGPPTYANTDPSGIMNFYWAYHAGQKFTLDDAAAAKVGSTPDAPGCLWNLVGSVSSYSYKPEVDPAYGYGRRDGEAQKKDCNVVVYIRIDPHHSTPGLAATMETTMIGPKRIHENYSATDAFLDKALAEAVANAKGGAPAPKL